MLEDLNWWREAQTGWENLSTISSYPKQFWVEFLEQLGDCDAAIGQILQNSLKLHSSAPAQ